MPFSDLFSRLRKARLVQVVVVYLGASWVLLEVTDVLTDALSLPAWVSPVVVLLLLAGLVIVAATAWVQTHPLLEARAGTDEVPEAWELDVRDLGQAVRRGRLPHLTWPRALLGGVVAFSLLFGAAGVYVLVGDQGPDPVFVADGAAPGIAVLPFEARGVDSGLYGEGLVDLISTNVDGVGGLRAIDSRTVLARWRQAGAGGGDLTSSLELARSVGARYAVVGTALGDTDEVRVSARLYDVTDGHEAGAAQVQGSPDSVLALVDALSVELLRDLLAGEDLGVASRSLARITTWSVPALRAFLRGEAATRQADFPAAIEAYEEALAADSTFALAAYRLGSAYGWTQARSSEASSRNRALAARYSDRLPARDAALLRASEGALDDADPEAMAELLELSITYPDDPDVWNMLGEARYHLGPMQLVPWSEAVAAFEQAIALDSSFAPAYIHPTELAIGAGRDSAKARALIDAYSRFAAADIRLEALEFAYDLAYGDPAGWPDGLSPGAVGYTGGVLARAGFRTLPAFRRLFPLVAEAGFTPPGAPPNFRTLARLFVAVDGGRVDVALERLPEVDPGTRAQAVAILIGDYGVPVPDPVVDRVLAFDSTADTATLLAAGTVAVHAGREAALDRGIGLLRRGEDAATDSIAGRMASRGADALEAYALWREGSPDAAVTRLEAVRRATIDYRLEPMNERVRSWIGLIHLEAGRIDQAIRYLSAVNQIPSAHLHLAEAYEAAGRTAEAAAAYADMIRVWADADPDFEPLARARQALQRLRSDA